MGTIAARRRSRPQRTRGTTDEEGRDRFGRHGEEVRHREGIPVHPLGQEGLDIISAHYIPDLHTVELKDWARRGGRGVYINHEASRTSNDCYVCEIPAGGKLAPQRQLFEEMIYVLDGRGSTTVWNDAGARISFEWGKGSLFAIPLNCWHQHFNGQGQSPARYVAVTNTPSVLNLYDDVDFVFNTEYDFKKRFNGEPDYFDNKGEQKGLLLDTNFVADAINLPLISVWVKLLTVPYRLLYPAILLFCCVGVYSINNRIFDVVLAAGFGLLGYAFRKAKCEAGPLLLGFVLGPLLETNIRRAMVISQGDPMVFIQHPISLVLLLATAGLLVMMILPSFRRTREEAFQDEEA